MATQVPSEPSWRRGMGWLVGVSCGGCRAGGTDVGSAGLREPKERKEDLKRVGRQSGWTGHVLMAASENLPSL